MEPREGDYGCHCNCCGQHKSEKALIKSVIFYKFSSARTTRDAEKYIYTF